jgi:hypothetical protein
MARLRDVVLFDGTRHHDDVFELTLLRKSGYDRFELSIFLTRRRLGIAQGGEKRILNLRLEFGAVHWRRRKRVLPDSL